MSSLFGANHQDHKVRVYCRDRDPKKCAALRDAFRRWSARQAGWGRAQHSTPFKFRDGAGARGAAGAAGAAGGGVAGGGVAGAGGGGAAGAAAGGGGGGGGAAPRAAKRARSLNFGAVEPLARASGVGGGGGGAVNGDGGGGGGGGSQRLSHSPIPE